MIKNKRKKILILGATVNQLPFVIIAKKNNCFTITLDNDQKSICHKFSDASAIISTTEKEIVLNYAKKHKVDGIVTCASDLALPTVAYTCNKMGLPFVEMEAVLKTVNKDLFKKFLLENKFKAPKYYIFSDSKSALKIIQKLKDKWIIKPVDSSGSKGVCLIDLNLKNENLFSTINNSFFFSSSKKIIVEEFIEGKNCSVDGFYNDGKIDVLYITNKLLTNLPLRTPTGHTVPSKLNIQTQINIKKSIKKILDLLKVKSSPFDFDVIVSKSGEIYFLEMSLRIGGNGIPKLIMYSSGYNLYNSAFLYAINQQIKRPTKGFTLNVLPTGVFLIYSNKSGKLNSIASKEILLKKYKESLKEIVYDLEIGEKIEKFTQGNHRIGHYILQAKSDKELMVLSKEFKKDLNLEIK